MYALYSDHYIIELPADHPFPIQKYRLVREQLLAERTLSPEELLEPALAAPTDLRLVHTEDYWQRLTSGTLPESAIRRLGLPWSEALVRRSRASVQGTLTTARIAIRCLQHDGWIQRMAVIDCDVHQGNGTAAIFADEPDVYTFSIHGANNYPLVKVPGTLDISLPDGTGDDEYLRALEPVLPRILSEFRPGLVFYLAGVDPHEGDRLGRLRLTHAGLRQRDELVLRACRDASIPVAVTLGGGYGQDIQDTVEAHCNTVQAARAVFDGTPPVQEQRPSK